MSYLIADSCLACGACAAACPNNAIIDKSSIFIINASKCTECVGAYESPKCAEVCPIAAPGPDPDNRESKEQLLERWKRQHPTA